MSEKRRMNVDVTNDQIKNLKLEQTVTVITKGKIVELEAERDGFDADDKPWPPSISLEVASTKVKEGNAFEELVDDEEEEDSEFLAVKPVATVATKSA